MCVTKRGLRHNVRLVALEVPRQAGLQRSLREVHADDLVTMRRREFEVTLGVALGPMRRIDADEFASLHALFEELEEHRPDPRVVHLRERGLSVHAEDRRAEERADLIRGDRVVAQAGFAEEGALAGALGAACVEEGSHFSEVSASLLGLSRIRLRSGIRSVQRQAWVMGEETLSRNLRRLGA